MSNIKYKVLLSTILLGTVIVGTFSMINMTKADHKSNELAGKVLMSAAMPDDKKDKYEGKNLVKNASFIAKIKVEKLKEKATEETIEMPLDSDSIGAKEGHKSYPFKIKYDVYEARVTDSIKNPKGQETIEIVDLGLVDSDVGGDYTQCQWIYIAIQSYLE